MTPSPSAASRSPHDPHRPLCLTPEGMFVFLGGFQTMQIRSSPSIVCAKLPRVETVDPELWDSALLGQEVEREGGGHRAPAGEPSSGALMLS